MQWTSWPQVAAEMMWSSQLALFSSTVPRNPPWRRRSSPSSWTRNNEIPGWTRNFSHVCVRIRSRPWLTNMNPSQLTLTEVRLVGLSPPPVPPWSDLTPVFSAGLISPEGLLLFLLGPEAAVVMQDRLAKCQDMTQPLPHYFVKSSHNTYLTGHMFNSTFLFHLF